MKEVHDAPKSDFGPPKAFKCQMCNRAMQQKNSAHRCKGIEKKITKACDICGKTFATMSGYNYHMQSYKHVRYECEQCDFKTKAEINLRKHLTKVHGKSKLKTT